MGRWKESFVRVREVDYDIQKHSKRAPTCRATYEEDKLKSRKNRAEAKCREWSDDTRRDRVRRGLDNALGIEARRGDTC